VSAPVPAAVAPLGTFTAATRRMAVEDRIELTSVGVDIGSSTTHVLFSRLTLERDDTRYVTTGREVIHRSEILFTPYRDRTTIDGDALREFFARQYVAAGLEPDGVDTGALILTGVALERRNARAIGDLFATEAGRFVAVSAGDQLEAILAAHGAGAVGLSRTHRTVLNIDIGGGTTKLAICRDGEVAEVAAVDVGARLVAYANDGAIIRLEDSGRRIARRIGIELAPGGLISPVQAGALADAMAEAVLAEIVPDAAPSGLLRKEPLRRRDGIRGVTFSGGVSEYVYGRADRLYGDLGELLASRLQAGIEALGLPILDAPGGIRATVIGASQYTIQVSGSTVYVAPLGTTPVRNVPVVTPAFGWPDGDIDRSTVASAIHDALRRFEVVEPVAIGVRWTGPASFRRISAFCEGLLDGLTDYLAAGCPMIIVFDGDVGGVIGLHLRDAGLDAPIVSIDGIDLREFDYIDIGEMIPTSGVVPVVVKSLVFA
jgi:ethanolamine utilization protein EutA